MNRLYSVITGLELPELRGEKLTGEQRGEIGQDDH